MIGVGTASGGKIGLNYERHGSGAPVLLIPPAATSSAIWLSHQVPALVAAGYQAVTFDARGMAPSGAPPGPYRLRDLVDDAAGLIEELGLAPCRVVGASLGAMTAQELALAYPDSVRAAVLLGTRARTDFYRKTMGRATAARMRDPEPPTDLETLSHLGQLFGRRTLADERMVSDWLALLRRFPVRGAGPAAQYEAAVIPDRTAALRTIARPCLVVAFADDVMTPATACREVADAIPGCRYIEIDDAGHFGFIERPEIVNETLINFLA
jgi:pimeloyl-ACP methyl ester carboxylesterase